MYQQHNDSPIAEPYLPESKKNEEWYLKSIRSYIEQWELESTVDSFGDGINYIEECMRYYRYYFGIQENKEYHFMEEVLPGVNLPANWIPGQKIASLMEHLKGSVVKQIANGKPTARAVSPDTLKKREQKFQRAIVELELRPVFEQLREMSGVAYQPIMGFSAQTKEDIEKLREYTEKEYNEKIVQALARQDMAENHYMEMWPRIFMDAALTGVGGKKIECYNGRTRWRQILAPFGIVDRTPNSDVNRGARYAGEIRYLTLGQILDEYYLTAEQKDKLLEKKKKEDYTKSKYPWFRSSGGKELYKVISLEWLDLKVLKYEENVDKYGNQNLVRTSRKRFSQNEREKKGKNLIKKPVQTIRQGTLIGDCLLVDWGERHNQIRSVPNLADTELSYHWYTPSMFLQKGVPLVGRLKEWQDRLDFCWFKINLAVQNDNGKKLKLDESQLPEGMTFSDVVTELKVNPIVPYNSLNKESDGQRPPSGNYVDVLDLTIDEKTVRSYLFLIDQIKREMEEIVSLPRIEQGMQQQIVGKGVQENTINQSTTGRLALYDSFMNWINKALQYSANHSKLLATADDAPETPFVFDETTLGYLQINKDLRFEDFTIYIDIKDVLQERDKDRLMQIAFAQAQNGLIGMEDYTKMLTLHSYTELLNYFDYSHKKKQREQKEAMIMQQQLALQSQNQMIEGQNENALIKEAGQNERALLKAGAGVMQEKMKANMQQPQV